MSDTYLADARAKGGTVSNQLKNQRMHNPHAHLIRKVCARQQDVLSSHATGAQQVWLQLHICCCNSQHRVTIPANTIVWHKGGEEENAWLTCSALATPRRVTSCFVTSTCLYASGSARLPCNPLSVQLLAEALLAAFSAAMTPVKHSLLDCHTMCKHAVISII